MESIDYSRILLNDLPAEFLLEVICRTIVMFIVILITLRASGKRGIKQLSVFELVLIIGLGSAAGDPMFYEDVGILPAFTVFGVVITMYILVTRLTEKAKWAEKLLEGKPSYVIRDGQLLYKEFKKSHLTRDELFSELRLVNVEHLGQVKLAVLETSGEISMLFFEDEEVKPGLPIFPHTAEAQPNHIATSAVCDQCGFYSEAPHPVNCPQCEADIWCKPLTTKRIG
jgi:uncharacterized membrane protein YcaP (DUF421 family)